jgi:hypothetical protein
LLALFQVACRITTRKEFHPIIASLVLPAAIVVDETVLGESHAKEV